MTRHRDREAGWPWPLHAFLLFVAGFLILLSRRETVAVAVVLIALQLWTVVRRRRIELHDAGMQVGSLELAWDDIELVQVRDGVPRARTGLFIRLTDEARDRLGLPEPRLREHGFGLHPPPTPQRDAARYDLFLRATIDQLETWSVIISVKLLRQAGDKLQAIRDQLAPRVHADLVVANPDTLTIAVEAASADDLLLGVQDAIASVLPDEARWNPSYSGGVMVLVGPLSLTSDPRAEQFLEHVKTSVAASVAGKPRIHAMFAERR